MKFSYKKQSSGKDLSSRTNDELDSIFGWNKGNQLKQQQSDEEQVRFLSNSSSLNQLIS